MRIQSDHSCTSATETRKRVVSSQTDNGFAQALASAVETNDDDGSSGSKPEFSAATYRLFAAIATERGDEAHASQFRARAADAREAGIPLHPAGVLSETGRWDYTEDAAAIPETGHFDTASGQGSATFIPYNATRAGGVEGEPEDCDPAAAAAETATASANDAINRLRIAAADLGDTIRGATTTRGA
jgi:hypothetical protein